MSTSTITSTVSRRSVTTPRKPRPVSIAGTGMSVNGGGQDLMTASCSSISSNHQNHSNSHNSNKLQRERPPLPKQASVSSSSAGKPRVAPVPSTLTSASSRDSLMTRSVDLTKRTPTTTAANNKKTTTTTTVKGTTTPLQSPAGQEQKPIAVAKQKSVEKIAPVVKRDLVNSNNTATATTTTTETTVTTVTAAAEEAVNGAIAESVEVVEQKLEQLQLATEEAVTPDSETVTPTNNNNVNNNVNDMFIAAEKNVAIPNGGKMDKEIQNLEKQQESLNNNNNNNTPAPVEVDTTPVHSSIEEAVDMTASMIAKSKITTEEEAKAALAERRRMARVEAERQAELERQRAEAAEEAERTRLMEEEEKFREWEVEANRVAQEQRQAEEERLAQAIEEAQKKDAEERAMREEESRLKQEQLEQEKKAREEAEKQRLEMAEKLKKEEKEREERRKRVEAIMSRTRAKGSAPNTPVKSGEEEKGSGNDKDIPRETAAQSPTNANGDNNNHESSAGFQAAQAEEQGTNGSVLGLKNGQQDSYEKTVTDKENALIGSFDNHFISETSGGMAETNNNNLTTTTTTNMETVLSAAPGENGFHKNGIDNSL